MYFKHVYYIKTKYIHIYLLLHLFLFHFFLHPQPVPLLNHFSHLQTEVGGLSITAHFCGIVSVCN